MEAAMGASLITILAATIASWMFGALWYMSLSKPWMTASGMSEEDIKPGGKQDPSPFIISFICEFVMAYMLAVLLLHTANDGAFTTVQALYSAFLIWLGFLLTTQTVNHRYHMKPWSLTLIDSGHWLGVVLIQALVMSVLGL